MNDNRFRADPFWSLWFLRCRLQFLLAKDLPKGGLHPFLWMFWGFWPFLHRFLGSQHLRSDRVGSRSHLRDSGVDLGAGSGSFLSRTTFLGDLTSFIFCIILSLRWYSKCSNIAVVTLYSLLRAVSPTVPLWCHPLWGGTYFSSSYKNSPSSSRSPSPLADCTILFH